MGYTHYWYQLGAIPAPVWGEIATHARAIIAHFNKGKTPLMSLVREYNDIGKRPSVTKDQIVFNGAGDQGHETFVLDRTPHGTPFGDASEGIFNCCKTACKTYDPAVTACLLMARYLAPYAIRLSSDGDRQDWEAGRKLLADATGMIFTDPQFVALWNGMEKFGPNHGNSPALSGWPARGGGDAPSLGGNRA